MRWLLIKDLQILRRSPLLVGLLIVYPIAIALMIGFALSSPPGKPKVAFYDQVPPGQGKIRIGNQQVNVAGYASDLLAGHGFTPLNSRKIPIICGLLGTAALTIADPSSASNVLSAIICFTATA